MAWEQAPEPTKGDYEDRETLRFAIGLKLEGTVVRIGDLRPSKFGGEMRFVDVDTTDGRKVSFGLSSWKLDRFEAVQYRAGDGIRVEVKAEQTKNGNTAGKPYFQVERRGGTERVESPEVSEFPTDDNPPF